jgi:hypothetical protein
MLWFYSFLIFLNTLGKIWKKIPALALCAVFCSCTKLVGWGVLLWSSQDPAIPSGTVLPIYIKSNINQVWVAGIPEEYRSADANAPDKFEVPLAQLELAGSKKAAIKRAEAFAPVSLLYAETLQDGLPIRDAADNNARRVYRLRAGEIVKILEKVEGTPALSSSGEPLAGDWYYTLTEDGTAGYCFSYRLRLFHYAGGAMDAAYIAEESQADAELDAVLAANWSPKSYETMIASGKIDLDALSQGWGFFPDRDAGKARLFFKDQNDKIIDKAFSFTAIARFGSGRLWRFENAPLQMQLFSDTELSVQYTEDGGALRSVLFVSLPSKISDIIFQENSRRNSLFQRIYSYGPLFSSTNYGVLILNANGSFSWNGFDLLIPSVIPGGSQNTGRITADLYLDSSLTERYAGAITMRFNGVKDGVRFLYSLENNGLRIESLTPDCVDGVTVTRRSASPTVIFFNKGASGGAVF